MMDMSRECSPSRMRLQLIIGWIVAASIALLSRTPGFPFDPGIGWVALLSVFMYSALFLFFHKVTKTVWNLANLAFMAMMGLSLHYSGGILSPFMVIIPLAYISSPAYVFRQPIGALLGMMTFLAVLALEYSGVTPPMRLTPQTIYAHAPTLLLLLGAIGSYLWIAGSIYNKNIDSLWQKTERENANKIVLLHQLSIAETKSHVAAVARRISHDVKGPLGAIREFVKLMRESEKLSPKGLKDCEDTVREINRLLAINDQLTSHVRAQSVLPAQEQEAIAPHAVFQDVISIIRFQPGADTVRFNLDDTAQGTLKIEFPRDSLHQIAFHLLKNSVEALLKRPEPRVIDIHISGCHHEAAISIQDNGPGITPSVMTQIENRMILPKESGWGVGLFIVRERLSSCDAVMTIDSKEGAGTCVRLTFPLAAPPIKSGHQEGTTA